MNFSKYFIVIAGLMVSCATFAQKSQTITLPDAMLISPNQILTINMEVNTQRSILCQVSPNPKIDLSNVYIDFNSEGSTQHKLFSENSGKVLLKVNNNNKDGFYFDGGEVRVGNDSSEVVSLDCHRVATPESTF